MKRLRLSASRRFLVSDDGTPFFWMGDTAWELFHRCTIEEADLYRVSGDLLYLLSSYRGLTIVDLARLELRGQLALAGMPLEMYLRGNRALVLDDELRQATERKATDLGCAPEEKLTVLDLYGNLLKEGKASELTLDLSHGPLFLRGSASLEALGTAWGALIKLRPSSFMAAGSVGTRTATLPEGATVVCEVIQSESVLQASLQLENRQAKLSLGAGEGLEHALAFVRLSLQQEGRTLSQVFPVTIGALAAFDDPGFTRSTAGIWGAEREGTIAWTPEAGHLAPGCLEITAPYNGRIVNWQQWYLRLKPNLPLYWSVWVKAEGLKQAHCQIALAQFASGKWLGDVVLMSPEACPNRDSDWVRFEGKINPEDWPEEFTNAALYVDVWKTEDTVPEGRLLVDELDLWQPEE